MKEAVLKAMSIFEVLYLHVESLDSVAKKKCYHDNTQFEIIVVDIFVYSN
jgi:hypothetical protein